MDGSNKKDEEEEMIKNLIRKSDSFVKTIASQNGFGKCLRIFFDQISLYFCDYFRLKTPKLLNQISI